MKIADSAINLYSQHLSVEQHQKRESLTVWDQGQDRKTTTDNDGRGQELKIHHLEISRQSSKVSISIEAKKAQSANEVTAPTTEDDEVMGDLNMRILKALFERITGRKFHLTTPQPPVAPPPPLQPLLPPQQARLPRPILLKPLPSKDQDLSTTTTNPIRNMNPPASGPKARLSPPMAKRSIFPCN